MRYHQQIVLLPVTWVWLVTICSGQGDKQKINLDIYFESLCPDSQNFINNQLHPHWHDIQQHVNIRFVPFGKSASLENGTKFACQHGSKECKGNRIMSCALSRIPEQDRQVQYLRCFMDVYKYVAIHDKEIGEKCAQLVGLDLKEAIERCYLTREGTKLQLLAEKDTNTIKPKFIPTVVYDGVFNQQLQDQSMKDFRETVCHLIRQRDPQGCPYRTVINI